MVDNKDIDNIDIAKMEIDNMDIDNIIIITMSDNNIYNSYGFGEGIRVVN